MGEYRQYLGAGGSGPAGCSQFSLPGQHGDQSQLLESDGKVPYIAGCAGGPHLSVCSLGKTQTGRQHKCVHKLLHKLFIYSYIGFSLALYSRWETGEFSIKFRECQKIN